MTVTTGTLRTDASDRELVAAARGGDTESFGVLVERHYAMVRAVARARLRNADTADDLAQEVFLRAHLNLRALREGGVFGNWVARLARNLCVDWIRRRVTRSHLLPLISIDEEALEVPDEGASDGRSRLVDAERERAVREALWRLSEQDRELVLMHYEEGIQQKEIAERLGVSPTVVCRRLERSLAVLRGDVDRQLTQVLSSGRTARRTARRAAACAVAFASMAPEAKAALVAQASFLSAGTSGSAVPATGFGSLFTGAGQWFAAGVGSAASGMKAGFLATALMTAVAGGGGWYYLSHRGAGERTVVEFPSTSSFAGMEVTSFKATDVGDSADGEIRLRPNEGAMLMYSVPTPAQMFVFLEQSGELKIEVYADGQMVEQDTLPTSLASASNESNMGVPDLTRFSYVERLPGGEARLYMLQTRSEKLADIIFRYRAAYDTGRIKVQDYADRVVAEAASLPFLPADESLRIKYLDALRARLVRMK